MNKTITRFTTLALLAFGSLAHAQQYVSDFENFTLASQSYYQDTTGADWQTSNARFEYSWDNTYDYWDHGFVYTNYNDSTNGTYTNLYGSITYNGYNNSSKYAVSQAGSYVKLVAPYDLVQGFWVTNTTYAYKTILNGDGISKKFGGVSGNDTDWFKLTVRGYYQGVLTADSVEFYLADYRFSDNTQDYIVKNWQWVDCMALGQVDSLTFSLSSTDNNSYGMLTPGFFAMDNFTTTQTVGIEENNMLQSANLYPNPVINALNVRFNSKITTTVSANLKDISGRSLQTANWSIQQGQNQFELPANQLEAGVYFLEIRNGQGVQTLKFIKQ